MDVIVLFLDLTINYSYSSSHKYTDCDSYLWDGIFMIHLEFIQIHILI